MVGKVFAIISTTSEKIIHADVYALGSGIGAENGEYALRAYTQPKSIVIKYVELDQKHLGG